MSTLIAEARASIEVLEAAVKLGEVTAESIRAGLLSRRKNLSQLQSKMDAPSPQATRIKLLGDIGDDQFITKMIDGSRAALRDLRNREPWVHYINRSYFLAYDGNELVGATYDLIKFLDTYPTYQGGEIWFEAGYVPRRKREKALVVRTGSDDEGWTILQEFRV